MFGKMRHPFHLAISSFNLAGMICHLGPPLHKPFHLQLFHEAATDRGKSAKWAAWDLPCAQHQRSENFPHRVTSPMSIACHYSKQLSGRNQAPSYSCILPRWHYLLSHLAAILDESVDVRSAAFLFTVLCHCVMSYCAICIQALDLIRRKTIHHLNK